MLKNLRVLLSPFVLLFSMQMSAQPNSVELKDGNGILVSSHSSIGGAYAAVPSPLTQAYIIEMTQAYNASNETYPISITLKIGGSMFNTITIRPASGVNGITISNTSSGANLMVFNDADYVILDGRPGGTGTVKALTFENTGTTSNSNTIALINGATHNVIRYCIVNNSTTGSAGRNVFIGTSPSNPSGNSNNLVEYCEFNSGRYTVNNSGTAANKNMNNKILGCVFTNIRFVGFWGQSGSGNTTVDSCVFYNTSAVGDGPFAILFDAQSDTALITRNRIYNIASSTGLIAHGISIRSTLSGGTINYSRIENNFIAMSSPNGISTNVKGIEYAGANLVHAEVYYNSIYVGGTMTANGTSGNVVSACFSKTASDTTSTYRIKNNLALNERSGGVAGVQHLAASFTNTNGIFDTDFNIYNSASGDLARLGTTVFQSFAAYQAALLPGLEANSNVDTIHYASATDLHLTGNSIGNLSFVGVPIAGIDFDIDGDARVTPYRGADESAPITFNCTGQPVAGTVAGALSACLNSSIDLNVSGASGGIGISYTWEAAPLGSTLFTNVGSGPTLNYFFNQPSSVRYIVTCTNSGLSDTSAVANIDTIPAPVVSGINVSNVSGGTYTFSATGGQNIISYSWNFGNGDTSNVASPTYTYPFTGSFTVNLTVSNGCATATAGTTVNVVTGLMGSFGATNHFRLFPNPASESVDLIFPTEPDNNVRICITDLSGKIIMETPVTNNRSKNSISLPINNLEQGMYFVTLIDKGSSKHTQRLNIIR